VLILGIESATGRVGCAIGGHEGVRASVQTTRDRRHAELLAPQIQAACAHADVDLRDLGAVAVDVGPGLYTGLRVGVTTAITMAHALRVPMVAVSSLDLVAYPLRHTGRTLAVVIDARRGEVFHARYGCLPGGVQRLNGPEVGPPEHVVSQILASSDDTLVVGDGAECYASMFEGLRGVELADPGFAHPSAESLVLLAHALALREEFVRPDEIQPLYLRRPDAQPQRPASPS
jgi:tRNA threonylcarbamoyladenosine biosynthesis protein TsaB